MASRSCDGCLGTGRCWICTGEGCDRCDRTGRCHLCRDAPQVIRLAPPVDPEPAQAPREQG